MFRFSIRDVLWLTVVLAVAGGGWANRRWRPGKMRITPAMAAGIANKPLTVLNLVKMIEDEESKLGERLTNYLPAKKG